MTRIFHPILLVLIFLLKSAVPLVAQGPPQKPQDRSASCARVWMGFEQAWGYNHRINRMADMVSFLPKPCEFESMHAAASGSGGDRALFRQYFANVEVPDAGFYEETMVFELEGKEGENILQTAEVSLTHPLLATAGTNYTAILNGFDLFTDSTVKADKFEAFSLAVDTVRLDQAKNKIDAQVSVSMRMNCKSPECPLLNQRVHYYLKVKVLFVVGNPMKVTSTDFQASYSWKKDSLQDLRPQHAGLLASPSTKVAIPGIRSISLDLSEEFHMRGWQSYILPIQMDSSGLLLVEYGLNFQQWDDDMYVAYRQYYRGKVKLPAKWATKRKAGSAVMQMGVQLLAFEEGEVLLDDFQGGVVWQTTHGNPRTSTDPRGEVRDAWEK